MKDKKNYLIDIDMTYGGRVLVQAKNRKEALRMGEWLAENSKIYEWYDWAVADGTGKVEEVKDKHKLSELKNEDFVSWVDADNVLHHRGSGNKHTIRLPERPQNEDKFRR